MARFGNNKALMRRVSDACKVLVGQDVQREHIRDDSGLPVNVFVSGVVGTGEQGCFDHIAPYWGLFQGGDLLKRLEEASGRACYAPNLGPVSSAWDRACELYAQLAGTTVDYGVAHSAKMGHDRFGRKYAPLFEGWGEGRNINLLGHSFGGTTARLFAQLLADGSAEERAVTPEDELSPLFRGGLIGRVHSVTCLATPHNGTTAIVSIEKNQPTWPFIPVYTFLSLIGTTPLVNGVYDLHLEHFGLSNPNGTYFGHRFSFRRLQHFLKSRDHCTADLSLYSAQKLNEKIPPRPELYYFSYPCVVTRPTLVDRRLPPLKEIKSPLMGYYGFQIGLGVGYTHKTATLPNGLEVLDPLWLQNDGCVPLASALYPEGQAHKKYAPGQPLQTGIWYRMPIKEGADHGYYCGWDPNNTDMEELVAFYVGHIRLLDRTYQAAGEEKELVMA